MKYCIISKESPWGHHAGGIGTYIGFLSQILTYKGIETHIITFNPSCGESLNQQLLGNKLYLHFIPLAKHPLPQSKYFYWYRYFYRKFFPQFLLARCWALSVAKYYGSLADKLSFKILEYPETMGEGAYLFKKNNSEKFICRIHSSSLLNIGGNFFEKFKIKHFQKAGCKNADFVFSPSRYSKTYYAKSILNIKEEVRVLANPYISQTKSVNWNTKSKNSIVYIGRLEFRKGLHVLLKALEDIVGGSYSVNIIGSKHPSRDNLDLQLHRHLQKYFGHDFPESFDILEKPIRHKLGNHSIVFWGQLQSEKIISQLEESYLFILPSLSENYPYVLLEARDCGCYCIATNTGGIPELLGKNISSQLFSPENHQELRLKILEAVKSYDINIQNLKEEKTTFNNFYDIEMQKEYFPAIKDNEK